MPKTDVSAPWFQRLCERARLSPDREALRSKRRGVWQGWSWADLAQDAELAARGWATLGVAAGDTIVAVGPLSAAFIVTVFAADALGASVVSANDDTGAHQLADARFAFADGAHELERVLRKRGVWLRHVVVGDGTHVATPPPQVTVLTAESLQTAGQGGEALAKPGVAHHGASDRTWLSDNPHADRVLADFEPGWSPGMAYLHNTWLADAARLVVPESGGDALADRCESKATLWLTPADGINQFKQRALERVPDGWLGGLGARAALSGRPGALRAVARARLRSVLGLRHIRTVQTDAGTDGNGLHLSARTLLQTLGIASVGLLPAPSPAAPVPGRAPSVPADALFQRSLAGSPL